METPPYKPLIMKMCIFLHSYPPNKQLLQYTEEAVCV